MGLNRQNIFKSLTVRSEIPIGVATGKNDVRTPLRAIDAEGHVAQRGLNLNVVESGFVDRVDEEPRRFITYPPGIIFARHLGPEGRSQPVLADILHCASEGKAVSVAEAIRLRVHLGGFTRSRLSQDDNAGHFENCWPAHGLPVTASEFDVQRRMFAVRPSEEAAIEGDG